MTEFLPIFGQMLPSTAILMLQSESNMTVLFIYVFCIPTLFKCERLLLWNLYFKGIILFMDFIVLYILEQYITPVFWTELAIELLGYVYTHVILRHILTLLTNIMLFKRWTNFFTIDIIIISYVYNIIHDISLLIIGLFTASNRILVKIVWLRKKFF